MLILNLRSELVCTQIVCSPFKDQFTIRLCKSMTVSVYICHGNGCWKQATLTHRELQSISYIEREPGAMESFKFAYSWAQDLWNDLDLQMGPSAMEPHKFAFKCALELWNHLHLLATGAQSYGIIKIKTTGR